MEGSEHTKEAVTSVLRSPEDTSMRGCSFHCSVIYANIAMWIFVDLTSSNRPIKSEHGGSKYSTATLITAS